VLVATRYCSYLLFSPLRFITSCLS